MRDKENMDCFKWYKNDRICYLCPYEEECIYEYKLYLFIDRFHCEHQDVYYGNVSFPRCTKDEKEYVNPENKEYCIGLQKCKAKEIENWKRKYKLEKLKKLDE